MSTPAAEVPVAAPAKPDQNRKVPQLLPNRFKQADFMRTIYDVQCARDITPEELLEEGYWAHVAHLLRSGDRIEVRPEDNSFFAEFIVLGAGRLWAQVEMIRFVQLTRDRRPKTQSQFTVEWGGSHSKYRVLRGTDVVKEGLETDVIAERWIKSHEEALDH